MAGWIVLGVVVLVVVYGVVAYNGLVRLRNRIENAWSQIDVQLRRRYDLIPNLVDTVKAYASHERETLEAVTEARNRGLQAETVPDQAEAENMITQALSRLLAVSEAYPQLRANENFAALQEELTATEGRIAYARQFYNDTVLRYNTRVQSFPAMLIARPLGFQERQYFDLDDDAAARGPIDVEF